MRFWRRGSVLSLSSLGSTFRKLSLGSCSHTPVPGTRGTIFHPDQRERGVSARETYLRLVSSSIHEVCCLRGARPKGPPRSARPSRAPDALEAGLPQPSGDCPPCAPSPGTAGRVALTRSAEMRRIRLAIVSLRDEAALRSGLAERSPGRTLTAIVIQGVSRAL